MPTSSFRVHRSFRNPALLVATVVVATAIGLSAHVIRSRDLPDRVTAFVSSPNPGSSDEPIRITWSPTDTGLKVACFYVSNTAPPDPADPDWPRITSVGFELPGAVSGFSLLSPLEGEWQLIEDVQKAVAGDVVTLDFAIVARVNPTGRAPESPRELRGIPPGQARTTRTPFCVSGAFPDRLPDLSTDVPNDTVATTIEGLINGVVVGFHGVAGQHQGVDTGIWVPPSARLRPIPMYP